MHKVDIYIHATELECWYNHEIETGWKSGPPEETFEVVQVCTNDGTDITPLLAPDILHDIQEEVYDKIR